MKIYAPGWTGLGVTNGFALSRKADKILFQTGSKILMMLIRDQRSNPIFP
jgi:hypothetical protein